MRTGISFTVSPTDRQRLMAVVKDRNAPQKHVWRAPEPKFRFRPLITGGWFEPDAGIQSVCLHP
ncbi:MAG: hypothetical protein EOQ92_11155 [Mesorhizobium sp.]|nr:MAG: hypothetical protein EOQ92_11155 [Mesorhizobium sp.]RWK45531.1 MAG: hypothetical protein EOR47_30360 [Mesorhizobium sp.]RWK93694.1 MAG: hypothetical protein EOR45_26570 [Mesorhizobium sp.]RWK96966.1 MAG: hypothetical protein EOR53_05865 [Mesorhizobium sp.]TIP58103.1 MAG: hypothetical protein E5X56_16810 [Mesorhizobium sp.]